MDNAAVKKLLKRYGVMPVKFMGQNFLVEQKALDKIALAANLSLTDCVLEIGAGLGALTFEIAKKAKKVIAVEKDRDLALILKDLLREKSVKNVEIIENDVLKLDFEKLVFNKVIGNIPYYLTSHLIRVLLENEKKPEQILLMVQKEVAKRICAKPPQMTLLAASVQFYSLAEILFFVPKGCFWPQPKVDSAVIRIVPFGNGYSAGFVKDFFAVLKAGFSQPRKQIVNNLTDKLKIDKEVIKDWLLENNLSPLQRAETLSLENWKKLAESYRIKK